MRATSRRVMTFAVVSTSVKKMVSSAKFHCMPRHLIVCFCSTSGKPSGIIQCGHAHL